MRVTITKPMRVNCLSGEVEITEQEYKRLLILNAIEEKAEKPFLNEKESIETPEKEKRITRKAKK